MTKPCHTAIAFAAAMLCAAALPARARELDVGPARALKLPSQAAAIAMNGDTIRIDPGTYADCAIWNAARLVIEAAGPGVILAGKTCAEKGIFIVEGADTRSGASPSPTQPSSGTTARAYAPRATT